MNGERGMRALTVKQPWAHFIAKQQKTVENRTWPTDYRGLLAIHAGAYSGWDKGAESSPVALEAWKHWAGTVNGIVRTPLTRGDAASFFTFGAVIAVAELAGCHFGPDFAGMCGATRPLCSPWAVRDQWHWVLEGVRRLDEPVPVRGKLGLWRLSEDAEKAVREQLEEVPRG